MNWNRTKDVFPDRDKMLLVAWDHSEAYTFDVMMYTNRGLGLVWYWEGHCWRQPDWWTYIEFPPPPEGTKP